MDSRKCICGFFFWLKTLFAFALSIGILGGEAYFVFYKYKLRQAEIARLGAFQNQTGGPDDPNQGVVIPIDPLLCAAPASSVLRTAASSARTGDTNVVTQLHRLEPPDGVKLFGFALDFSIDTPAQIRDRLGGRQPPVIAGFVQVTPDDLAENMSNWFAQSTAAVHGMLELTVMPIVPLERFNQSSWDKIAILMYRLNTRHGVPILLRFCHEMNGNWSPFGQRPIAFKAAWKALAVALHSRTNMTAMIWGPNPGQGYPYGTDPNQPVPAATTAEFRALDTNNDGRFDENDDPYGPYWPGSEFVDWVGMSLYNYGYSATTRNYGAISTTYIQSQLSGPWTESEATTANRTIEDFYNRYVNGFQKPFALTESGSPYIVTPGDPTVTAAELTAKQTWWRQMLRFLGDANYYPNLKLVVHFEEAKTENAAVGLTAYKDFTITTKDGTRTAFLADIAGSERATANQSGFLTWGKNLNYTCDGRVKLV
ncbi:glycoside hydrolase superfamily [Cladochytrium replicatum]|nr:glycoside hydrolase superfamily [Cladochytrium replicatum]